ncbi:MAG: hypothetical protein IPG79_14345 [Saprospiraceae bacterium]|nr:hypothetical protein [Saprospiraceae bacterium]
MSLPNEYLDLELEDGTFIKIECTSIGREKVSVQNFLFANLLKSISSTIKQVRSSLNTINPDKVQIKFGIEASIESGQLAAIIVKGEGKSNIEVTIEWSNSN